MEPLGPIACRRHTQVSKSVRRGRAAAVAAARRHNSRLSGHIPCSDYENCCVHGRRTWCGPGARAAALNSQRPFSKRKVTVGPNNGHDRIPKSRFGTFDGTKHACPASGAHDHSRRVSFSGDLNGGAVRTNEFRTLGGPKTKIQRVNSIQ
jgi:hypothetical protein